VDPIVSALAQHGIPGLVIAGLFWWLLLKDRDLKNERDARIKDAQAYTQLALQLQDRINATVQKLSDLFDELRKKGPYR
jgi:hypothetical protein